jgi:hypothetical protein
MASSKWLSERRLKDERATLFANMPRGQRNVTHYSTDKSQGAAAANGVARSNLSYNKDVKPEVCL